MAAASARAKIDGDPTSRPARYHVIIDHFEARETPASVDYPEDAFFLRFAHPLYEDFVDLTPGDLVKAKKGGRVEREIAFTRLRRSFRNRHEVEVPVNAILCVTMYARSANNNGQRCIKQNGVVKPEVGFWQVHGQSGFDSKVEIRSVHLESELRGGNKALNLAIKGMIRRLAISLVDAGSVLVKKYDGPNALIRNPDLFKSAMVGMVRDVYTPTFVSLRQPRIPKIRDYYAPQYLTANGDALPISSYMIRTCMKDTLYPDPEAYLRAFRVCLEQRPELGGESEFVRVASTYLGSDSEDPSQGDADLRRKWFTCMEIVASMTCIYNNAVPYLMDMERVGQQPPVGKSVRPMPFGADHVMDSDKTKFAEVERMVDAEKDYGHDCEDSSMNADMRKRGLSRDGSDSVLELLVRINGLFVSYVCQMACGGDDRQITTDDGIFHFCAVLIPRAYVARMEENGGIPPPDRRPVTGDPIRKWERQYKIGYSRDGTARGHVGVMYTEGTNTVCPMQFCYDPQVDAARSATTQFVEGTVAGTIREMGEWLCIYHANVFRDPSTMSNFYKYLICALCGDGPHHKKRGIYDYLFVDMHAARGTYGVAVELLARGDDGVGLALIPKMRYSPEEIEALESNFTFRGMAYGMYTGGQSSVLGRLKQCPGIDAVDLVKGIPGISTGIPRHVPDRPTERYQYIRISPMDVDLHNPHRKREIVDAVRRILIKGGDSIRSVHVAGHLVQHVPMEPNSMNGPIPLCSLSILIFYSVSMSASIASYMKRLL